MVEKKTWKILIVDDDADVQLVTRLVLEDFSYLDMKVELLQAVTSEEGFILARSNPDIAVAIIDVVMETNVSGLELVGRIRNELGNRLVRIILRTGQPGVAPEKDVVIKYDINDYKEKAELTFQKLQTSVITAIRSYNDLVTIDNSRIGLEHIINATAGLFKYQMLKSFAAGLLEQIVSLLNIERDILLGHFSSIAAAGSEETSTYTVYAAMGEFEKYTNLSVGEIDDEQLREDLREVQAVGHGIKKSNRIILYFQTSTGASSVVYMKGIEQLTELNERLLNVFCSNISIAFDNLCLRNEIEETQKELIMNLGEFVDMRSLETGAHVVRVSKISRLIGLKLGFSEMEADKMAIISPMHDVGKITIPDSILNKPGKLSEDEFEIMKTHSINGFKLLSKSNKPLFRDSAIVALQHHERFDGKGYPNGFSGEQIHIFARIVGLVDVYDALTNKRVYKDAWSPEQARDYIAEQRGRQFDPDIVDVFLESFEEIKSISRIYNDSYMLV